jgi:hypothetical protein
MNPLKTTVTTSSRYLKGAMPDMPICAWWNGVLSTPMQINNNKKMAEILKGNKSLTKYFI